MSPEFAAQILASGADAMMIAVGPFALKMWMTQVRHGMRLDNIEKLQKEARANV